MSVLGGRIVAVITARGGSKRIPRKNLRELGGLPLIAHTIRAAQGVPAITATYVSTEDPEIARVSTAHGAQVIQRPIELAQDSTRSEPVIQHAIEALGLKAEDWICLLQPTSPLRASADIQGLIDDVQKASAPSGLTAVECEHHPAKSFELHSGRIAPLRDWASFSAPAQSLPKTFRQNGAVYLCRVDEFQKMGRLASEGSVVREMPAERSVDIDTELDWMMAEGFLKGV